MMTTHLVLGSSGFVGEHLTQRLLDQGDRVIAVDIQAHSIQHPHCIFEQIDIRNFRFSPVFKDVSVIHHCASLVPLSHSKSSMSSVNIEGTENILQAFKDHGLDHFIYYSSSSVTGFHAHDITEEVIPCPVEYYGESKLMAEKLVADFCRDQKIPYAILRPRTIGGPGRLGLFELLFSWISKNKNIILPGPGPDLFQMIHIDDLISASLSVIRNHGTGIFNVGNEAKNSLTEDLQALIKLSHSSSQILCLPKEAVSVLKALTTLSLNPFAPWQYLAFNERHILDTKKLRAIGWAPKFSNLEILAEGYDSYLTNKSIHPSLHKRPIDLLRFGFLR